MVETGTYKLTDILIKLILYFKSYFALKNNDKSIK